MESILIYAGLLLKKRLVLYSPRVESLIKVCRYDYFNNKGAKRKRSLYSCNFLLPWEIDLNPFFGQYPQIIPPEDTRKFGSLVFRRYKMGTFARIGDIIYF